MFDEGEFKTLGVATGLIALNIAVMWIFAFTPLNMINDILFGTFFFLGVAVFGLALTGGLYIARKGLSGGDKGLAVAGTAIIQVAYGVFGAGIIGFLPPATQALAIIGAGIVSIMIALFAGLLVYGTGKDFSHWGRYSNYLFLGVFGISFIGSFTPTLIIIAFALALLGFTVYLIHQIYMTKTRSETPLLNGLGIYTAFMGVFVQVIQMIIRMLAKR